MQDNQLSQNVYSKPVTLKNIFKFALPTIAMTVFMSFYTMVDGLFVSNLIGTNALSAEVANYCQEYLSRYLLFTIPILLMNNFTLYMIAADKSTLSLIITDSKEVLSC